LAIFALLRLHAARLVQLDALCGDGSTVGAWAKDYIRFDADRLGRSSYAPKSATECACCRLKTV